MTRRARRLRLSGRTAAVWALGVAALVLYAVFVPVHAALYGTTPALAFLLGVAVCAAPPLALIRPRVAVPMFCIGATVSPLVASTAGGVSAPWPWSVPALLSFLLLVGVVTGVHGARAGLVPLLAAAGGSLVALLVRPDVLAHPGASASATADLIVATTVAVAAYLLALLVASRLRVGAELTREREHAALEEARRALVEERTRIARELHDVIAHSMSVIQVQASTARYRLPELEPATAAEFEDIAATARTSLTEMRRMLGVLRTEDQSVDLAPQNGLDDIPALVDTMRRAGVEVGLSLTGLAESRVPTATQIAAYRIVQESLSNAVRHAPGERVSVQIRATDAALSIQVRNVATMVPGRGSGHGLRGMQERTEILGGSFAAGPDGDTWTVDATLPVESDGASRRDDSPSSHPPQESP